jgi:hypothetical protein
MVDKVARVLLFLAFVAIGLWLLVLGVSGLSVGLASRGWSEAKGQVADWAMAYHTHQRENWVEMSYEAQVTYAYAVGQSAYTSTTGSHFGTEAEANEFLGRYPVGSEVMVRYDPANPERSVLETGVQTMDLLQILGGVLLIGGSAWWLIARVRRRNAHQDEQAVQEPESGEGQGGT